VIRRLRAWVRRARVTTPPPALSLAAPGLIACWLVFVVAHFGHTLVFLFPDYYVGDVGAMAVDLVLIVLLSIGLRALSVDWLDR
jgi:hypothetical protein